MALLTVDTVGSELVITVTDTGVGIDPAELEHAFEMFSTVGSDKGAWKNGLGVGLCLVRRLAVMYARRQCDGAQCRARDRQHVCDPAACAHPVDHHRIGGHVRFGLARFSNRCRARSSLSRMSDLV